MELIQTIRAEIERRKIAYRSSDNLQDAIRYDEITSLLSFLDTLESEKPMNPSGHRDPQGLRGPSGIDGDKNWYLLDQEIIDWCGKFNPSIREEIQSTAYHFADWQKEKMLEEAVEEEVFDFSSSLEAHPHVNIPLDNKKFRSGDKIRIIILKED